jgi:hypothetical protein
MRTHFAALPALFLLACGSGSNGQGGGPDGGAPSDGGGNDSPVGSNDGGHPKGDAGGGDGAQGDSAMPAGDGGTKSKIGALVGGFVGVNAFIDDPSSLLPPLGNVREYHNWSWCEGNGSASYPGYPDNQNSFILFGGTWDWDTYYADLKTAGVFGYPVIQGSVSWLNNSAVPPVPASASTTDPASYAAHADEMFQYAARYGSTKVATSLLQLASGQPVVTGQGSLQYIEDWNEEDAWWINPDGSPIFSPDAYAAMASADIDGNQGKMGKTLGMKTADPTIKMVMGGLAGHGTSTVTWEDSETAYLDGVRAWAAANRGGDFPADVLNVHYYSFGPSASGTTNPQPALSPEDDHVTTRMNVLSAYRDKNLPGKELWLTEFGYDTDPQSILHAPALGSNSAEVVQGQWIIRYYLAVMAAGFDRAFLFVSRDSCTGSDSACALQFDTSGVAGVKGAETPKTAYYFIATFRSRLATYGWHGAQTSAPTGVMVDTFKDPTTSKGAYVVWSPTSKGTVVSGVSISVPGATTASQVTLVDGQMNGTESTLPISTGSVTVDVSETPTIILVDAIP